MCIQLKLHKYCNNVTDYIYNLIDYFFNKQIYVFKLN